MSTVATPVETTFDNPDFLSKDLSDEVMRTLRGNIATEEEIAEFITQIDELEKHVNRFTTVGNIALVEAVFDPVIDFTAPMEVPHSKDPYRAAVHGLGWTSLHN